MVPSKSENVTGKPHKGRIKNWCFLPQGKDGRRLAVIGDALDHEYIREGIHTSYIVKYDAATGEIETQNSRYTLVNEGEPSPRKGWPNPGDRMKFLGKNGYDHELAYAMKFFTVNQEVIVKRCFVSDFNHTIWFEDIQGEWNGAMFELIK